MSQLIFLDAGKTAQTLQGKKKKRALHIDRENAHIFSDASKNFAIQFRDSWTEPQGTDDMNIAVLFTAFSQSTVTRRSFKMLFSRRDACIPNYMFWHSFWWL